VREQASDDFALSCMEPERPSGSDALRDQQEALMKAVTLFGPACCSFDRSRGVVSICPLGPALMRHCLEWE